MSRTARATVVALSLACLGGGTALPLLAPFLVEEPAPACCRGRCCCTGEKTEGESGRPALRLLCGCGKPGGAVVPGPLRLEADLASPVRPGWVEPRRLAADASGPTVIDRPHAPPSPPPKGRLSA